MFPMRYLSPILFIISNLFLVVLLCSFVFMFQRQSNQPVGLICHKQWNIQDIIIKLQIIQRESNTEFDLVREQLLELLKALADGIGFGFDFNRENIIFSLNEEIHFIRRIGLRPVPRNHFKLRNERL